MAVTQTVMWTALPNGVDAGRLTLSVLVSPRLMADATNPTLGQHFPDFASWWDTPITWQVQFGNGPLRNATRISDPPRQDLWEALFPPSTYVRKHDFPNLDNKIIRSFPVRNLMSFIKSRWLEVATASPTEFPKVDTLLNNASFGKIAWLSDRNTLEKERQLIKNVKDQLAVHKVIPPGPPAPPKDFAQLRHFYEPMADKITQTQLTPSGSKTFSAYKRINPVKPKIDFHQMVTMLAQHPDLMRALGLVFDLSLDLPANISSPTTVRVKPTWPRQSPDVTPFTRCDVTPNVFRPRHRQNNAEIAGGKLRLADKLPDQSPRYEIIQIDTDGAALKSLSLANNLVKSKIPKLKTTDTPKEFSLPALRSVGIGIAKAGRAASLHLDLKQAAIKNDDVDNGNPVVLSAEDVTRGYAIDVFDEHSQRWYSLCSRTGTAKFTTPDPDIEVSLSDEGWVSKPGLMGAADESHPGERKAHEGMLRWTGWSLVAQRPGKTVSPDEKAEAIENVAKTAFKLEVTYNAAEDSLPPLRYGRSYRMRARVVDLAGNVAPSGPPTLLNFTHTLGPEHFGRFDPIASPAMLFRSPKTEAESLERLIIRSNFDTAPLASQPVERHVTPPKIDQDTAEMLGMFDSATGIDTSLYAMIAAREDGSFGEKDGDGNYVHTGAHEDENNYGQPYYDVDQLQFTVETPNVARLPYLPDPLARGAALRGLPGTAAGSVYKQTFGPPSTETWPEARPFRLRLTERSISGNTSGPPIFSGNLLEVIAPKATMAEVLISCYLDETDLEKTGLWDWIQNKPGLTQAKKNQLKADILAGKHWMFTPFRKLVLIHAVRQPLVVSAFDNLSVGKQLAKTYARLQDNMTTSRKSTERIDIRGKWTDVDDYLDEDTGDWEPTKETDVDSLAFRVPVTPKNPSNEEGRIRIDGRHEFYDTKFRNVDYDAIATTRFKEFFNERTEITFDDQTARDLHTQWTGPAAGDNDLGVVPESDVVKSLDGSTTYVRGASTSSGDYFMDYEAGTIQRTTGSTMPTDVDVKVQYLVPPITRITPTPTNRDVLNSARPDAPKVLYVIPTFEWEKTPLDGGIQSKRKGNGLRVYLERPWWSSGDGELLGVVLWPTGPGLQLLPPDKAKPFITQWGMDPLWKSAATAHKLPKTTDFTSSNPARSNSNLTLEEVPGSKFSVAGHEVHPDEDRTLWFADITLPQGASYTPFIRLALARYQPKSVPNAHLSRVVLADFAQLTPDRSVTITYSGAGPSTQASISVVGRSYKKGSGHVGPSEMEVELQQRHPEAPSDEEDLGWIPAPGPNVLLSPSPVPGGSTLWTGQIALPSGRVPSQRLVIREFERIADRFTPNGLATERRMTFADTLLLSE